MMEIFDFDQGSPEWLECRRGIPTASRFATVLAKGKTPGGPSVTRKEYLRRLAGEVITGQLSESYSNAHMERGHEMEPDARSLYAFMRDCDPMPVGFLRNGRAGASPDSLIGLGGLLEIKSKLPHLLIEAIERDDFPPEHKAQCQGQLLIAERAWLDIAIYWPGLPLVIYREQRDEPYIARLVDALDAFNEELDLLVERVRSYGNRDHAREAFRSSITAEMMQTGTFGG
jgi:hypothetical protein